MGVKILSQMQCLSDWVQTDKHSASCGTIHTERIILRKVGKVWKEAIIMVFQAADTDSVQQEAG